MSSTKHMRVWIPTKTDVAFDRIKRKFTLHLSGTPFKALANNKFVDDAIYNWTYADEQKKNVTGMFQQRKKTVFNIATA